MPAGSAFTVNKVPFALQPLFPDSHKAESMSAAPRPVWHITDLPKDQEINPWDACHALTNRGFGIAGAPAVDFAEPDIEQQWAVEGPDQVAARAFAAANEQTCTAPDPPDSRYPSPSPFDWRWFQDEGHSGLGGARTQIKNPPARITIAHLDTGYRKGHNL